MKVPLFYFARYLLSSLFPLNELIHKPGDNTVCRRKVLPPGWTIELSSYRLPRYYNDSVDRAARINAHFDEAEREATDKRSLDTLVDSARRTETGGELEAAKAGDAASALTLKVGG